MSPDELQQHLQQEPFIPVRIHMSNGRSHEIRHPEMAIIGDEVVVVGVHSEGKAFPQIRLLSLVNINEVEPLAMAR